MSIEKDKGRLPIGFEGRDIDHLHDSAMTLYGWKILLHVRLLYESDLFLHCAINVLFINE